MMETNMIANGEHDEVPNMSKVVTCAGTVSATRMFRRKQGVYKDSLNTFGTEVTRVAKEVGTDGKLGDQTLTRT